MSPRPTEGWEAHLQPNPVMRTVDVVLFRPFYGGPVLGEFVDRINAEQGAVIVRRDTDTTLADPPTLRLPEAVAAALFAGLLEHFGGPGADRELRADYLHERDRVDRLIEVLVRPPVMVAGQPVSTPRYPGADGTPS